MSPEDILALAYRALASPGGLLLRTNDPDKAKQAFYRAIKKYSEAEGLGDLRFTTVEHEEGNLRIARVPGPKALNGTTKGENT